MTPLERREIREEIRTCALLDVPADFRMRPPYDLEAERAVIATMREGNRPPAWLNEGHFWLPFHGAVFALLEVMIERGTEITNELIVRLLERQGFVGRDIAHAVRRVTDETPAVLPLAQAAGRVVRLARQRHARVELARIDAALSDLQADPRAIASKLRDIASGLDGTGATDVIRGDA